jgi:hypothetical protein
VQRGHSGCSRKGKRLRDKGPRHRPKTLDAFWNPRGGLGKACATLPEGPGHDCERYDVDSGTEKQPFRMPRWHLVDGRTCISNASRWFREKCGVDQRIRTPGKGIVAAVSGVAQRSLTRPVAFAGEHVALVAWGSFTRTPAFVHSGPCFWSNIKTYSNSWPR